MQNINELIGIIKGINFDGVINDDEIKHLNMWVRKNRNLVYDNRQTELIKLVDGVLEDHVIDDEEKTLILSVCEDFLKEMGDNSGKIYELNGIIEGVVCDGVVNKEEILHLNKWMDLYGKNVSEYNIGKELHRMINTVIETGTITEEERDSILDMLKEKISSSQFESKLDYLCRLVKQKKNIGVDLIDILNNESAITEIHSRAERNLMQAVGSCNGYCANSEIIVVSLVLIAMLEYDGNYYDSVRDTYSDLYSKFSEQRIEGKIRSILNRYKKQSELESGNRTRIINVALENSIVPQKFLSAFFEFVFDIYKLNFEYDLPDDPYEDFKFVFEGLQSNMLSDGDDISVNVTQKTYKLIAATKQLISRSSGLDPVIKLSIIIARLIDRRFWGKTVKIFNPYLKEGFEGWEKTLKENSRGGHERKTNDTELRSRWEPKYVMSDNNIYLKPPIHRVKAQYDYRDITVVVMNNGEEIYRNNECDIREIIGGYQVNTERIEIIDPLGKLVYRLMAGDEIIYDSKDKLYRNCIVFNDSGQEISNNTDFEGTAYVVYRKGETVLDNLISKDRYCIGYKLIRVGDAIEIGHDVFNFSAMAKPGIFGQRYNNCFVQKNGDDKLISVYYDTCFVVFEADKTAKTFEININGNPRKLSEMRKKTTEKVSSVKYVVELDLLESGVYEIEVNQLGAGTQNRILQASFAYDLRLSFSKTVIDESIYRVRVLSGLLSYGIDTEINADNFSPDFIKFEYNGDIYNYYIPFDFGFYKLSDSEWCNTSEDMWIDDINDRCVLSLYDSQCDELLLYNEQGTLCEEGIRLTDKGFYKQLPIYFINSYKNGNKFVTLVFTTDGKAKYIVQCFNKCVIDEEKTEIVFSDNPKSISITPVFHGKNKVFYEIFNSSGEKLLTSKQLESGQTSILTNFSSFQEYTIQFHEKTKILQLRKNTLLLEEHKVFYAKKDFKGRSFRIAEGYYNQMVRSKYLIDRFEERQWFFKRYYVIFTDIIDEQEGIFEGQVYCKTNQGDYYLRNINPVEIEICSDVIDDTMDIYITNQGDGLLFDSKYGGIMNLIEHPTAPDIFLYTIDLKGNEEQ